MGQYWRIANITKKEQMNLGKSLEFNYFNNSSVLTLMKLLSSHWKNDEIVVVGDYTKRELNGENLYEAVSKFKCLEKRYSDEELIETARKYRYIVNHAKGRYVDLKQNLCPSDRKDKIYQWEFIPSNILFSDVIHPLPLLLSGDENGLGGGDYIDPCPISYNDDTNSLVRVTTNDRLVGAWQDDSASLELVEHKREIHKKYLELDAYFLKTNRYSFKTEVNMSFNYEKYEKLISSTTEIAFEWDKLSPLELKAMLIADIMELIPMHFIFNNEKFIALYDKQLEKIRLELGEDELPHKDYYVKELEDIVFLIPETFYDDYNINSQKAQDKSIFFYEHCLFDEVFKD